MTVFPDGTKESLHGHNFQVELTLTLLSREMVPFSVYKDALKNIVKNWDERVLIAERCPQFTRENASMGSLQFSLCGKKYLLPEDEVVLLPVDNISSERLAEQLLFLFVEELGPSHLSQLREIALRLDESPGQGVTCIWRAP